MNILYGTIMAVIGVYFALSALVALIWHKQVPPYKWLTSRSSLLFKDYVHYFYIVIGITLTVLGILWICGIIWTN